MADNENLKYQCGCGKSYTSYPAYSTHKKHKHQNQHIQGTQLPKQYIPKRGRPSFSLPNQTLNTEHPYSALTTIEITLLKLEEKYGQILTEPETDGDMNILDIYRDCQKIIINKNGQLMAKAIKTFNQVLVNHISQSISSPLSVFLQELTLYLLDTIKVQQKGENNEDSYSTVDIVLFNRFFMRKGQKQRVAQLAKRASKSPKMFLQVTVALSEYLCKLGLLDSLLSLKQ